MASGGCAKKETDTSAASTSTISSIAALPKATGAVTAASSSARVANLDLSRLEHEWENSAKATTGKKLSSLASVTWDSSTSRALCETGAIVKNVYREASSPDKVLCYVGVMEKLKLFTSSYDGTDKYYALTGAGANSSMKLKFNIAKDTNNGIKTFKMWACENSTTTNDQFLSESMTNGNASVISVHNGENQSDLASFTYSSRATVAGAVDSTGAWTSKTLTNGVSAVLTIATLTYAENVYASIAQSSSALSINAFRSGTFSAPNVTPVTFNGQIYASVQGLKMDKLSTFALGDGSAVYKASYGTCGDACTFSGTSSWNGDTLANLSTASTGDHYATVSGGTLPTISTPVTGYTSTDEQWDCTAPSATPFTTVELTKITGDSAGAVSMAACDAQYGLDDTNFVDCEEAR